MSDSPASTADLARPAVVARDLPAPIRATLRQAEANFEKALECRDDDRMAECVAPALTAAMGYLLCGATIRAARALRIAGLALVLLDRPADAAQRLRAARQSLDDAGAGAVTLAGVDVTLAEALRSLGHLATAQERLQSARAAYAEAGHDELLPTIDHDLAIFTAELGDAAAAVRQLVTVRQAFLDQRDREGVAACSHNIGLLLHDLGQLDDAVEYFQEARSIFLAVGRDAEAAACDQNVGVVLHDMGRPEEAARRLLDARNRYARTGAMRSVAECEHNLSVVLTVLGRADEAAACLAKAEAAGVRAPADTGSHAAVTPLDAVSA